MGCHRWQVQDSITRDTLGTSLHMTEAGVPPGAWARQAQEKCEKAALGWSSVLSPSFPALTSYSDPSGDQQTCSEGKAKRMGDLGKLVQEETNEGEGGEGKEGEE